MFALCDSALRYRAIVVTQTLNIEDKKIKQIPTVPASGIEMAEQNGVHLLARCLQFEGPRWGTG